MRKELEILEVELKKSKKGKQYSTYKTSQGIMSCFEEEVVKQLDQYIDSGVVAVEVAERNGYKNITKFYELVTSASQPAGAKTKDPATAEASSEPAFRINIKENSKGFKWETTIRANSEKEAKDRLNKAVDIAKAKVAELEKCQVSEAKIETGEVEVIDNE